MRTTRFWVGTAMLIGPCMMAVIATTSANPFIGIGRVDGHVSYHGRPLTGGMVMFLPDDREDSDWVNVPIGKDGRFSIDPGWRRAAKASRFRICVLPDRHQFALSPPIEEARPGVSPADRAGNTRGHIVPIFHAPQPLRGPRPDPVPANVPEFPRRFTNPIESGLTVQLSREPASVSIDIED